MRHLRYTFMESPVGRLLLAGDGRHLTLVGFPAGKGVVTPQADWQRTDEGFAEAKGQLQAYFAGSRQDFDLSLDLRGTDFQRTVWRELMRIPFGTTISYGELARRIGHPAASRAVGAANGANPIPIIVPCHRVIGSSGKLTGFGGGLETKKWLLAWERAGTARDQLQLL